jgi:hypothetical protein
MFADVRKVADGFNQAGAGVPRMRAGKPDSLDSRNRVDL